MESRPDGSTPPPIELDDWEQLDDRSRWDRSKIYTQTQSTSRINQNITVTSAPQSNIPGPTPLLLGHNQSISSYQSTSVSLQNMGDTTLFKHATLATPSILGPFSQLTSLQQPGLTIPSYQTSALAFPYMSPVPGQILTDPACLYNRGYPQISATFPYSFPSNTNSTGPQPLLSLQSQLPQPVPSFPTAAATINPSKAADLTQVRSELDVQLLTSGFAALSTRSNPSNPIIQASNNQPTAPIALLPTPSSSTSIIRSISNPTGNGLMQQPALPIQPLSAITEWGVAQKFSSQQAAKSSVSMPKPLIVPADDIATGNAATSEKDLENPRSAGGVPYIPRLERQRQMQAQQREANRRAATTQRPQSSSKGNTNNANKSGAGGGGLRRPQPLLPTPPPGSSSTSTSSQSQSTSSAEHEASPGECSTSESFLPPGPIRILRRNDQSSSARSATAGGARSGAGADATANANGGAIKSLEQREAEYNQLKERLFSDCRCGECSWCACDRTPGDGSSMAEAPKQLEVQGGPPDRIIQSTAYASPPHAVRIFFLNYLLNVFNIFHFGQILNFFLQQQEVVDEFRDKTETGIYSRILPRPKS